MIVSALMRLFILLAIVGLVFLSGMISIRYLFPTKPR